MKVTDPEVYQALERAASPFKVGDVVVLKSGGPKMTVKHTIAAGDAMRFDNPATSYPDRVGVTWWTGVALAKELLPAATLRLATAEDK